MSKFSIWYRSGMSAIYEIGFMVLPIFIWIAAILSASPFTNIDELAAWPFLALSLWTNGLRDGVRTFSSNPTDDIEVKRKDKFEREALVILAVIGVASTSVLLTCSVLKSLGALTKLWAAHQHLTWFSLVFGFATAWAAKALFIQRSDYGHYA